MPDKSVPSSWGDRLVDATVTLLCWAYFTLGFIFIFSPRYLAFFFFSPQREQGFQRLTNLFFRIFFRIVRLTAPRHRWNIDRRIPSLGSSVIVCNHLSYLDPLLLISLLDRQKTIVKTRFFHVPIFGWFIRNVGYLPADSEGQHARLVIAQMEKMETFLGAGGNLFVFLEGTRSRDGQIGPLNRGALKIARMCRAPVHILHLTGTDRLFPPGKFFFTTRRRNTITLSLADTIDTELGRKLTLGALEERITQTWRRQEMAEPCAS